MKHLLRLIIALLFIFPNVTFGQGDIVLGKMDSLQSNILNESRELMVYVPKNPSSDKTYPVIYLLDGDAHFSSLVGTLEHLSSNNLIPEMMVVAIPNTNRTRDFTPSKVEPNPPMVTAEFSEQSGGGKNFLGFMEKELFPYIESKYPTASYRMFIGHSLGGLLVMDALLDKPELFTSYISIDPSMWWNNKKLLGAYDTANFKDEKYINKSLYLGIANTLEVGMDTTSVRAAKEPMFDHINSIFETRDVLKDKNRSAITFNSKYYENDSHGSVSFISTYDGLRFLFEFYQFEIQFSDVMTPNTDIVIRIKKHYESVSSLLGYINKPDEGMLNGMGYQLMEMDKLDLAEQFLKANIEYYPESFNVYDSYGDYCLKIGNKKEARTYFEKALSKEENPASREKLEKLKSE